MIETEENRISHPPIFCEQCPSLAMAVVQDSPLCLKCMTRVVKGRTDEWILDNTRPLEIRPFAVMDGTVGGQSEDDSNQVA